MYIHDAYYESLVGKGLKSKCGVCTCIIKVYYESLVGKGLKSKCGVCTCIIKVYYESLVGKGLKSKCGVCTCIIKVYSSSDTFECVQWLVCLAMASNSVQLVLGVAVVS